MEIKKYNLYLEENKLFNYNLQLTNAEIVVNFCNSHLNINRESQEVLYLLGCDSKQKLTGIFEISRGTINRSFCSPIEIFKRLLLNNCNNFVIVHNHLSDERPSNEDIEIYKRLKKLSKLFEIKFNDSLIISKDKYYSFFEEFGV